MKIRTLWLTSVTLFAGGLLIEPAQAEPDIEARLSRLERMLSEGNLSDVQLQLQRLRQELQQLRGMIERQQYQIDTLKRAQQDLAADLDTRFNQSPPVAIDAASASRPPAPLATPSRMETPPPTGANPATPPLLDEPSAYAAALDLMKARRYEEASGAFEALLARYPTGDFSDNARYWLGESLYARRDYAAAMTQFRRVLDEYPTSPKVPGAKLRIGLILAEQGDQAGAEAVLREVLEQYPGSPEARQARDRLARLGRAPRQ